MKLKMNMGHMSGPFTSADKVGVDVTGDVRVLPDAPYMMPWEFRHTYPGGSLADFPYGFPPVFVYVKAGLSGLVELRLWVEYYFLKRNRGFNPVALIPYVGDKLGEKVDISKDGMPETMNETVHSHCSWKFSSTKKGMLNLDRDAAPDLSPNSDGFEIRLDRASAQVRPDGGSVTMVPRFVFTGDGTKASVQLITLAANIVLTDIDKSVPVPVPTPGPGASLAQKVYFLFNKRNHSEPANNVPGNFPNKQDQLKTLRVFMEGIKAKYGLQNVQKIEVHGFASAPGTTQYNDTLSNDRAQHIARWLKTNYQTEIKPDMIWPHGEPLTGDEKDNPEQRRVEVKVILRAGAKP